MSGALDKSRWISMTGLFIAVFVLFAGQARAAGYPTAGGNTFSGSAEGWTVKSATCSIPVLCGASGGYDGVSGNPPGSLAANSNITLGVLSLFKTNVVTESPDFKVGDGGAGTLRLQRQFAPGGLLELAPQATYNVSLIDKTSGVDSKPITETISAASGFNDKEGPVSLAAGHTYAIQIAAETSSTVLGLSLGTSSIRFDNVALTGPGSNPGPGPGPDPGPGGGDDGGNGGNGANGGNSLTDTRLLSMVQSSLGSATLKGNRLYVKAKCPAKVGRACKITIQGLLTKSKPATTKRTAKVAKGKAKQLVLKVKPAVRKKVAGRKQLLFREEVKAGPAKATVFKRLKLIKR